MSAQDESDTSGAEVANDGGTMISPGSYSMTLGPNELRQSGPELTWEKLKDAVSDDGHWSDKFVIHPDRVPTDELKSSHKHTTRIIVAMLRHEATANGFVTEGMVDDMIDKYLVPVCNRADDHAAREYIHETYRPLIEDHPYETPAPNTQGYFTTEAGQVDAAEATLEDRLDIPKHIDRAEDVLGVDRWHQAVGISGQTDESLTHCLDDVTALMDSVAAMKLYRALVGSFERYLAILLEHFDGQFPPWLAPEQVRLLPVGTSNQEYVESVATCLPTARVSVTDATETLSQWIRVAHNDCIPYMIIVGSDESGSTISVRDRQERTRENVDQPVCRLPRDRTQRAPGQAHGHQTSVTNESRVATVLGRATASSPGRRHIDRG